jgi:hypothetical protein
MNSLNRRKLEALEKAIEATRDYQRGLPLRKARGETGAKVRAVLAKLEAIADRVASR